MPAGNNSEDSIMSSDSKEPTLLSPKEVYEKLLQALEPPAAKSKKRAEKNSDSDISAQETPSSQSDSDAPKAEKSALEKMDEKIQLLKKRAELKEAENLQAVKDEADLAAAEDARQKILDKVRVTVPDMAVTKIGSNMETTELAEREFTEAGKIKMFAAGGGKIAKDASDFFELQLAQRDDLLDRVGFYRGIIVDHSKPNVTSRGFRDALHRINPIKKPTATKLSPEYETAPVTPLYLKPPQSGHYETSYTFSEHVHQAQKNGVKSLKFSLEAAGGNPKIKVGVGVGYGSGEQTETKEAQAGKTVYVVTSYCLPKIELSFDERKPCASPEFVSAVVAALEETSAESAPKLLEVLKAFGHFVAHRMTLGGRLYGTHKKMLDGKKSAEDVSQETFKAAKVAVSSLVASAQASVEQKEAQRKQSLEQSGEESQSMELFAVGGEGQFLSDAGQWSESLGNYRRWSSIMQDDLLPTIALLPPQLYKRCCDALKVYAEKRTIQELLEEGAHFLFYGNYQDVAGQYAKKVYFRIANKINAKVLTVKSASDNIEVALDSPKENSLNQIWFMSGLGYIVSALSSTDAAFALTVRDATDTTLIIREAGAYPNQIWKATASGHLVNKALNKTLDFSSAVRLENKSENFALSQLWTFTVLNSLPPMPVFEQAPIEQNLAQPEQPVELPNHGFPEGEFMLMASDDSSLCVSAPNELDAKGQEMIKLQTAIYAENQFWKATPEGKIISSRDKDFCLTIKDDGVILAKATSDTPQQLWRYDPERCSLISQNNNMRVSQKNDRAHENEGFLMKPSTYAGFANFIAQPKNKWKPYTASEAVLGSRGDAIARVFRTNRVIQAYIYNNSQHHIKLYRQYSLLGQCTSAPDQIPPGQSATFCQYSSGEALGAVLYRKYNPSEEVCDGPAVMFYFGHADREGERKAIYVREVIVSHLPGFENHDPEGLIRDWLANAARDGQKKGIGLFLIGDDTHIDDNNKAWLHIHHNVYYSG